MNGDLNNPPPAGPMETPGAVGEPGMPPLRLFGVMDTPGLFRDIETPPVVRP